MSTTPTRGPTGTASGTAVNPILVADGIEKRYGGVHALRGAVLEAYPGEVLALVGENGSGKSTLLGIISGQRWPDSGRIVLDGAEVALPDPITALDAGIAMVTQETTLVPELSVAENIFLGRLPRHPLGIDWRQTSREASSLLEGLGLAIDPRRLVGELRPDEQQLVEVARAIAIDARVLILDEPTSSLTDDEVEYLFGLVRRLKETGVATIFVSHRLGEVLEIADRVTVLRDGETVGSGPIQEYDRERMILEMVGHEPEEFTASSGQELAEPVLRVHHLSVPGKVDGLDFELGAGEIVGLAGLVGAGRSDVFEALFGLRIDAEADVDLHGDPYVPTSPADAMRRGIGYVPAERKTLGLVFELSVVENLMLASGALRSPLATLSSSAELRAATRAFDRFNITAPSPRAPIGTLSGGNQQKVLLAKWLETEPRVLLLDEPTRGVDVGAKSEIYHLLQSAKNEGIAILISSSETPELLMLCDRILVMFRGRCMATMSRREASEARIAHFATGHD
jgi:ABC-type sugar transport system ATPase subunit